MQATANPARRPVRQAYRHNACGKTSVLPLTLAENLAKDQHAHRTLFCSCCKRLFPSSEFKWEDGEPVAA